MWIWLSLLAAISVVTEGSDRAFIQFGSRACPACQLVQPVMDQLAAEGWLIRYVDAHQDPLTAERFGISRTPTLIVMQHGREIDRIVGALPQAELKKRLTEGGQPSKAVTPEAPSTSRRLAGPSRSSLLGPNHPSRRANSTASVPGDNDRRSRNSAVRGESKVAIIGINHPLYSKYHPAQPVDNADSMAGLKLRDPLAAAGSQVGVHPLLKEVVRLPASPQSLAATVRIQVEYEDRKSVGTGTIIHTVGEQALVLTCAHLFRDSEKYPPISVEVFSEGKAVRLVGNVVDVRKDQVDLALIRLRSTQPLVKVPVLPKGETLRERDAVFSIGCDLGAEPSRRDSMVSKLNRYLGASNVEIAGAPVQGRSGGGLFDASGRLVGVCFAADNVLDEGLFVGPEAIHEQLEKFRLNHLIKAAKTAPEKSMSRTH